MDLTTLVSDMRHDLKSPLAGMKAIIYSLRNALKKGETAQAETQIAKLEGRIDTLVGEINKYSDLVLDRVTKPSDGV